MIELEIDAEVFSTALDAVSVINDEPALVFQEEGLSIVTADPGQVILVNLGLRKSEFYTYDVSGRQKLTFNVKDLSNLLAGAEGPATISITHNVSVVIPAKYGFKNYTIPLLGETADSITPKNLPYDSRCKLDIRALEGVIRDANKVDTEYLLFSVDEDNSLLVEMKGEKGNATATLEWDKALISGDFSEDANFILIANTLNEALSVGKKFTNIAKMEFAAQLLPVALEYQVLFDGVLKQYIAPVLREATKQ